MAIIAVLIYNGLKISQENDELKNRVDQMSEIENNFNMSIASVGSFKLFY
jgi:hypothetical protein